MDSAAIVYSKYMAKHFDAHFTIGMLSFVHYRKWGLFAVDPDLCSYVVVSKFVK